VQAAAARLFERRHQHPTVALCRWLVADEGQALAENVVHFADLDRTDRRHRRELGEHFQHGLRLSQHERRQLVEPCQPVPPGRAPGQCRKTFHYRQCKVA
jgi:hypothetical protein